MPIKRIFGFTLILSAFWLINSGYFKPLLLGLGVISVVAVIALVERMISQDEESFPIFMPSWKLPGYLVWMLWQIILANLQVTKLVWMGSSAISPVIFTTRAGQKTEVGKVFYANSITMTPGTATLSLQGDVLEVHALTKSIAADLQKGDMDRRVSELEAK